MIDQNTADPSLIIVAVGLAYLAGTLLKRKKTANERDTRPPTTVERGEQLAYILGRGPAELKPVWVGARTSKEEKTGGGGKGFGGRGGAKQIIYFEDAQLLCCLGPARKLNAIYENQKVIFQGPIDPTTAPSGTWLTTLNGDSFQIFWGEESQPICDDLADPSRVGIASRWPFVCWFFFKQKKLGTSATWGTMWADIECSCIGTALPDSECEFLESEEGAKDTGMNLAHCLYQLCTGSYPHGNGQDPSEWDFGALRAMGAAIEEERFPQNLQITNGTNLEDILEDALGDAGCVLALGNGKIVPLLVREVEDPPVMDDRVLAIPRMSFDINHDQARDDRLQFMYPSVINNFRTTPVISDDDATARLGRRRSSRDEQIPTVIDPKTAAVVAERKRLYMQTEASKVTVRAIKTARELLPGQVAVHPEVGLLRIAASELSANTRIAVVEATIERLSLPPTGWEPPDGDSGGEDGTATADTVFVPVEAPHELVGEALRLCVVRGREDARAIDATVWVSSDGSTYQNVGTQTLTASYGKLLEEIPEDRPTILDDSPLIESTTEAMQRVQDFSNDPASWYAGVQVCLIEDEIFYLRSQSAVLGGYRLNGLIGARIDTFKTRHPVGSEVLIFNPLSLERFTSPAWGTGQTLYIKVQPAGVPIDEISPVTLKLRGRALTPLPIDNLSPLKYGFEDTIHFTWTDRIRRGTGTGAGEIIAGEPIADTPDPEGPYLVEVLARPSGVIVRSNTVTDPEWDYEFVDREVDIGGDFSFDLRITPLKNNAGGNPRTYKIIGVS